MKKSILCVMSLLLICILLAGCNLIRKKPTKLPTIIPTESLADSPTESLTDSPADSSANSPEDSPTESPFDEIIETQVDAPKVDIDWNKLVYQIKDTEGYTYDVTIKISPWILTSNEDIIKSAWNEVGQGKQIPGFNNWQLEKKNNSYVRYHMTSFKDTFLNSYIFNSPMTDMYYSVGTISIQNTTKEWDITDPRTVDFSFGFNDHKSSNLCIGRVFFSSETEDYCNGMFCNASMKGNSWGPCSFILMSPENNSPNEPDGQYYGSLLNKGYLESYSVRHSILSLSINDEDLGDKKDILLGVIGSDGICAEPEIRLSSPYDY